MGVEGLRIKYGFKSSSKKFYNLKLFFSDTNIKFVTIIVMAA